MPKYRYAYDGDQKIVDIWDVPPPSDGTSTFYTCIACGTALIAKIKGEKREKHFAHRTRVTCSEETYVHRLAKQTFFDVYSHCLTTNEPFLIVLSYPRMCDKFVKILGHRCNLGTLYKAHDLTQYYDGIKLEQRDDSFVPDVLIFSTQNPDRKIYIEIAVTHFLSEEKRKSDHRIIEIPIEDEGDIDKIRGRKLSEKEASFVNFDRQSAAIPDEECACATKTYYYLFIYKSGKSFMGDGTIREIESQRRKLGDTVQYVRLIPTSYFREPGLLFQRLVEEARTRGYPVKNCFLCRFAGQNWDDLSDAPIFCRKLKQVCHSNAAVDCRHFWVRPLEQPENA